MLGDLNVPYTLGYIMLSPDTTWQEYRESSSRLSDAQRTISGAADGVQDMYSAVEVLPGTTLATELRSMGLLLGDHRGYTYRLTDARVRLLYKAISLLRALGRPLGRLAAEQARKDRRREMRGTE